ncbi:NfeD family protein [uncultured Veillonella sp.]|uniref:NfeD family protein n=1 Tax=uncultured Veillonella sp. TaxID=159268 RepID=UPI00262B0D77|nr:NfeD family protein [uncultured Veillonella sp.]
MIVGLFIGGLIFLGIEFMVPGFGVFGLIGMMSLLGSLYYALGADVMAAVIVTIVAVVALFLTIWVLKQFPDSRLGKKLTLTLESTTEKGYTGNDDRHDLLGKEGVVQTVLRPSGKVIIDDEPVDVVTDGEFLEVGTMVKVIATTGGRVVVRPIHS